jgi:hypothetical protein
MYQPKQHGRVCLVVLLLEVLLQGCSRTHPANAEQDPASCALAGVGLLHHHDGVASGALSLDVAVLDVHVGG